jgi:hypothetical protein
MKRAFPSGAAFAEILHKSKRVKKTNMLREQILYSGLINPGTAINLKINFPLCEKECAKLQTIPKNNTHFLKNVFQCWRRFQAFFCYKFISNSFIFRENVILLSEKNTLYSTMKNKEM